MTMHTDAEYREQDLEDLMDAWHRSIDTLKLMWCQETASRVQRTFDEILNYLHAGETQWDTSDSPDGVLVRLVKEAGA